MRSLLIGGTLFAAILATNGLILTLSAGDNDLVGRLASVEEGRQITGGACVLDLAVIGSACGFPHVTFGEGLENLAVSPSGPGNTDARPATCSCSTTTYQKNHGLCVPEPPG